MAVKLHLLSPINTSSFGAVDTAIPSDATMSPAVGFRSADGNGVVQIGTSADARLGLETPRTAYTTDSPVKPEAVIATTGLYNSWRQGPIEGLILGGEWDISLTAYATGGAGVGANFRFAVGIFKGFSADGSDAELVTKILSSESDGLTTSGGSRTEVVSGVATVSEVILENEYLFFALACKIVGDQDTKGDRTFGLRRSTNTFVQHPDIVPLGEILVGWVGL